MKLIFYHYVHCPFCIRVRMALGFFQLPYQSVVVPYHDEDTPVNLSGKKMLPIMHFESGAKNESLDIIEALDINNFFQTGALKQSKDLTVFNDLLNKLGVNVHNLAMPYWIWTPEFDQNSREYFQSKKEAKRGPFNDLVKKRAQFSLELLRDLSEVAQDLRPFYRSDKFSLYDILLASHLWGLYVVPEFQFPEELHQYLQKVKELCRFNYHEDFWR